MIQENLQENKQENHQRIEQRNGRKFAGRYNDPIDNLLIELSSNVEPFFYPLDSYVTHVSHRILKDIKSNLLELDYHIW